MVDGERAIYNLIMPGEGRVLNALFILKNNKKIKIWKIKNKFWKFTLLFFATIVGVFILYLAGAWGWYFYSNGRAKSGSTIGREFRVKENIERAMADNYGGKIPRNFQMYISAVEKGDYEFE